MKKISLAIILTSLVSFFMCFSNASNLDEGYSLIVIYPLIYAVCATAICSLLQDKRAGGRLTVSVFLGIQWLRNVLLPATGIAGGYFRDAAIAASQDAAHLASVLCLYELIITSIVCYLILKVSKKRPAPAKTSYFLSGNYQIYLVFIALAFALYLSSGRDMYTFFALSASGDRAFTAETNMVARSIIGQGMSLSTVLGLFYAHNRFKTTQKKQYFWLALAISLIRIGIISNESESRISIVYSVSVQLFLMLALFPAQRKTTYRAILAMGIAMVGAMTVYKSFHAFLYDSYSEAVERHLSTFGYTDVASLVNVNFYGVQMVARNLHISQSLDLNLQSFIADFVRNTFGLSRLIPTIGTPTVAQYNLYIYHGEQSAGYLYSSTAYGYQYYGFLLAPLAATINMLLAVFMENILIRLRRVDLINMLCIVYTRVAFTMFACFPISWNYTTRTLIIGALVVGGASLLNRQRKRVGHPDFVQIPAGAEEGG